MNEFVLIYRGHGTDGGAMSPDAMQAHMQLWQAWFAKLGEEGHLKDWGAPLQGAGKQVTKGGVITDGPFAEGKEVVGGFSIIKAKDIDEAAKIAKSCPCFETGGQVEVRPVQAM